MSANVGEERFFLAIWREGWKTAIAQWKEDASSQMTAFYDMH